MDVETNAALFVLLMKVLPERIGPATRVFERMPKRNRRITGIPWHRQIIFFQ